MIVLATDLSKHFEITGNLKAMAEANQQKDAQEDPELIMKLVMKVRCTAGSGNWDMLLLLELPLESPLGAHSEPTPDRV
jgi:hypothetical protein